MAMYNISMELATEALHLRGNQKIVVWKAVHPSKEGGEIGKVMKSGNRLLVENPPVHQGRSNNHQTFRIVASLEGGGEASVGVKYFNDDGDVEARLNWIKENATALKKAGVKLPKRMHQDGSALIYHWVEGRRANDDEKLDALIALEKSGLADHPFVDKGHWRLNKDGPHLIIG
ncbi:MAG: hypothetical protein QXR53_00790 [Candidatus Norongarragalinales archaeon]